MVARTALGAVFGFACLVGLAGRATADGINPPYWSGDETVAEARSYFLRGDPTPRPEELVEGDTGADVESAIGGLVRQHELDGHAGIWPVGTLQMETDTRPALRGQVNMWAQITWLAQCEGGHVFVQDGAPGARATLTAETELEPAGQQPPPFGDVWMQSTYQIHTERKPLQQLVRAEGNTLVDELVIGRMGAREPASAGLLGVGSVMLARSR